MIKISELHPKSQFEKLSDDDLQAINGGQGFQITTVGTVLVTGVNVGGGQIINGTESSSTFQAGLGSPRISARLFAGGFSQSFPSA